MGGDRCLLPACWPHRFGPSPLRFTFARLAVATPATCAARHATADAAALAVVPVTRQIWSALTTAHAALCPQSRRALRHQPMTDGLARCAVRPRPTQTKVAATPLPPPAVSVQPRFSVRHHPTCATPGGPGMPLLGGEDSAIVARDRSERWRSLGESLCRVVTRPPRGTPVRGMWLLARSMMLPRSSVRASAARAAWRRNERHNRDGRRHRAESPARRVADCRDVLTAGHSTFKIATRPVRIQTLDR